MLPQVNARVLAITTAGSSEDWDQPAGPTGAVKWQGDTDAYVIDKIRTVYDMRQGGMTKVRDTTIRISSTLMDANGAAIDLNQGDIITYTFQGQQHSRKLMEFQNPFLPGLAIQEYIVLHLNPAAQEVALESE